MYKVYHNAVSEQINELFTNSESNHHYPTTYASNNNFLVNFTMAKKGKRAISVAGAKIWNELPRPVKEDQSLESFKAKLNELLLNDCTLFLLLYVKTSLNNRSSINFHFSGRE